MKKIFKTVTVSLICGLCLFSATACLGANKSECNKQENEVREVVISETQDGNDCPDCPQVPDCPTCPDDPESPEIPKEPKKEHKRHKGGHRRHRARPYRHHRKIRLLPDKILTDEEDETENKDEKETFIFTVQYDN